MLFIIARNVPDTASAPGRDAHFIAVLVTLGDFGDLTASQDTEFNELVGLSAGSADALLKFGVSDDLTYDKTPILHGCRRIA